MEFERHCDLIVEQAELLADHLAGQDLRTAVPSCPGWLVDLTGDRIAWRHSFEPAAVTVQGPVTDLLLHLYKRRDDRIDVQGNQDLLAYYLERVSFG